MRLTISNRADFKGTISFLFGKRVSINTKQSVEERLKSENLTIDKLTNKMALKVFNRIKLKSDVLSFLTKPVVVISLSAAVLAGALVIPFALIFVIPFGGIILFPIMVIGGGIGGFFLGYSIENSLKGHFSEVSKAYKEQSKLLNGYIELVKSATVPLEFILEEPKPVWTYSVPVDLKIPNVTATVTGQVSE